MSGTLYLCATPIGNLEDITFRVINTLKEVDLIAAEDTRHSIKLLNHFEIKTKMTSYHEYNRVEKAKVLVKQLQEGKDIALITDAGTPGISDPGEELVRQCHEAGITVTALPGACALINALIISGQPTRRFCFEAFLPKDKKEKVAVLEELKNETRTIIIPMIHTNGKSLYTTYVPVTHHYPDRWRISIKSIEKNDDAIMIQPTTIRRKKYITAVKLEICFPTMKIGTVKRNRLRRVSNAGGAECKDITIQNIAEKDWKRQQDN